MEAQEAPMMLQFHGVGARRFARVFFQLFPDALRFLDFFGNACSLPIVSQYQHMGGIIRNSRAMLPESRLGMLLLTRLLSQWSVVYLKTF